MRLSFVSLLSAVAAYDREWQEYCQEQGIDTNGEIPEAFKANVDFVKEFNKTGNGAELSYIGPFAAMSNEEYRSTILGGFNPGSIYGDLPKVGTHEASGLEAPADMDWTMKGAVSPVKNQGKCGSCWAFSATGALEGHWQLATGNLQFISEQQLVDCDKRSQGCKGGLMQFAYAFFHGHDAAVENSYPYSAQEGACKTNFQTAVPRGSVTGFKDIVTGERSLVDAVGNVGPVSVAVDAADRTFQLYKRGVLTGACGHQLNHAMLAVGYGELTGSNYWKVKNSWGESWGMSGFLLLERGVNKCGIADGPPSYPMVHPPTINV